MSPNINAGNSQSENFNIPQKHTHKKGENFGPNISMQPQSCSMSAASVTVSKVCPTLQRLDRTQRKAIMASL